MSGERGDSPERDGSPERGGSPARRAKGTSARLEWLGLAAIVAAFSVLFFKNAWVDEDAYISFRQIEQLFAGHGLRWNPHERVQAFTHPLWLGVLALGRGLTSDLYLVAILASWLACLALLANLRRALPSTPRFALLALLLVSSKSFFDFTSSGLETPLVYALLSLYLLHFFRIVTTAEPASPQDPLRLTGLLSLLLLTRHDLLLLVAPAHAAALLHFRHLGHRRLARDVALGLMPFVLWTLFALVYYGFPLPNTAYAKLGTGLPRTLLLQQGLHYVTSLLRDDPLVAAVLLAGLALAFERRHEAGRAVALGIAATLVYVVFVGGDYMSGRFFAASYLAAALTLARRFAPPRAAQAVLVAAAALYAWGLSGSPITSGTGYTRERPDEHGVGDQRGLLFQTTGLHRWLARDRAAPFPDHRWTREGRAIAAGEAAVVARANIGFMGYHAGTGKIIVDRLALSDPLLARLPSQPIWRIGHFPRRIPAGYLESIALETGSRIEDPALRAYHARLRLVTEGPLLRGERLRAIVALNLGLARPRPPARGS